jgi:hypothetical protein
VLKYQGASLSVIPQFSPISSLLPRHNDNQTLRPIWKRVCCASPGLYQPSSESRTRYAGTASLCLYVFTSLRLSVSRIFHSNVFQSNAPLLHTPYGRSLLHTPPRYLPSYPLSTIQIHTDMMYAPFPCFVSYVIISFQRVRSSIDQLARANTANTASIHRTQTNTGQGNYADRLTLLR